MSVYRKEYAAEIRIFRTSARNCGTTAEWLRNFAEAMTIHFDG